MEKNPKSSKYYLQITRGAIDTLLVLFTLGMFANLFIEIPSDLARGNAWSWVFANSAVIAIHAILGTILLIASIASLILAIINHRNSWIAASAVGLVFTALAAYAGSDFLSAGQTNLSSFLMAIGFLGALVSYTLAVYQPKNPLQE
jgi:hypothetical protein